MSIPLPTAAVLDPDTDDVRLWFGPDQKTFSDGLLWRVVGAVCWPRETIVGGDAVNLGAVIVAGMALQGPRKGECWVFGSAPWYGVQALVEGTKLVDAGLSRWMTNAWTVYCCRRYWWGNQDDGTAITWRRQVRDDAGLAVQVRFSPVHWDQQTDVRAVVSGLIAHGRLWYGADTQLARDWEGSLSVMGGGEPTPMLHALYCLGLGMSRIRL